MLRLENIKKTFNPGTVNEKCAVNGLSLHLKPGDFATIVGSNGAGKSTLLNAVAGSFYVDEGSILLDGRDIGTHVLPNAEFKFYLTADSKTRAARRGKELAEKGYAVDFKALQKEIEERDRNDSTREFSPLRKAEDAVEIDTSDLSVEEVVAAIKQKIQEKV